MPTTFSTEVEPDAPRVKTKPQRSGGWLSRLLRRVRLGTAGDDETLVVVNTTAISWRVYHDYHMLGIIDAGEERRFQLTKRGSLNVRPIDGENVDYLVLELDVRVHRVRIYKRRMSKDVEVYDMRAA